MDERTLRELELAEVTALYGWAQRAVEKVAQAPAAARDVSTLDWDSLQEAVRTCTQCGLCEKRKQAVFGVGSRSGPWMFVGEGPGADEDELGDPFVGQAGKLLDSRLAAAGLARGRDVYIANVVKCRPPGNRTPTPEEAGANTTLVVVVTDAAIDKLACHLVAQSAHDGFARALRPAHTRFDGDLAITLATGAVEAHLDRLRATAADVVAEAIRLAPG